ncbi:MAG: Gx transporter family protein [Candidatus Omnitrophota bacterium]
MKGLGELNEYRNTYKTAMLIAMACVLQISESLIPHPLPGLRLGLANMITIIAMVTLGVHYAVEIAVMRTIVSALIMGSFMSPAFILSFSAAVISTLVMALLYKISQFNYRGRLSIIGISIIGALFHNIVQICLAFFLLIRHPGIFVFLPWLCIGAVLMGGVTGVVAARVCQILNKHEFFPSQVAGKMHPRKIQHIFPRSCSFHNPSGWDMPYLPGSSFVHRLAAEIKIVLIFSLSLLVLIFSNLWLYFWLFLFLSSVLVISQTSVNFLFAKTKPASALILAAFLLPLFFNSDFGLADFKITADGLTTGILFALRIVFLISLSAVLVRTTSPEALVKGLTRILSPLRVLKISQKRIAAVLYLSWTAIPGFWEIARHALRSSELKKIKNLCNIVPLLSEFIAAMYLEVEFRSHKMVDNASKFA